MPLDSSRIFDGPKQPNYISELNLDPKLDKGLRNIRDLIRSTLREGLRSWTNSIKTEELFTSLQAVVLPKSLQIKFRMQGSFSYETCNQPNQTPPQQTDLDDGVFMPISFFFHDGVRNPIVASEGYFMAVERILEPLCREHGWILDTDKNSCVRVVVSKDAHLDLALYAIPDDEYSTLVETFSRNSATFAEALSDSSVLDEGFYEAIPTTSLMLAHREEGWKPSDPRKLELWFKDAITTHGKQVRRISRYLKGWRDHTWSNSKLSSIALMAAVVSIFDEAERGIIDKRDDLALSYVLQHLPYKLLSEIRNPVVSGQRLDEGWSDADRKEYSDEATKLGQVVDQVIYNENSPKTANDLLRGGFGKFLPSNVNLIVADESNDNEKVPASVLTTGLLKDISDDSAVRSAVEKGGDSRFG